jgi:hypothetical protein
MSWIKGYRETKLKKIQSTKEEKVKSIQLRDQIRAEKEDMRRLKYPTANEKVERAKTVGGRALKFAGSLARTSAASFGTMQRQTAKRRTRIRGNVRARTGASFVAPQGSDISLSGAVAANNWAGERNVMNTQFFNDASQSRDILGTEERRNMELVSSKRNPFDTNQETNIGTKKKEVKYY